VAETHLLATRCPVYRRHDSRKHDIEALVDEPRIGALEGSGLAMPIAPQPRGEARCHVPEIGELYAG
jgi:hypothetical protein